MKAFLEFKVNFKNLDDAIKEYETKNHYQPILLMSYETAFAVSSIVPPCDGDHELCSDDCIKGVFEGYKIFTDDDMEFGEVDVR